MDLVNILITGGGGILLGYIFKYLIQNKQNKSNEYINIINMQRHDITKLNNKVERLREEMSEKEKLLTLLESSSWDSPFSYWLKDKQGYYIYVNKSFEHEYGVTDVIDKSDVDLFGEEAAKKYVAHDKLLLSSDRDYMIFTDEMEGKVTYKWKRKAGSLVIGVAGLDVKNICEENESKEVRD